MPSFTSSSIRPDSEKSIRFPSGPTSTFFVTSQTTATTESCLAASNRTVMSATRPTRTPRTFTGAPGSSPCTDSSKNTAKALRLGE
jgi:hypothetical protein